MNVSLYINHYIRIYCYVTTHRIGPKQIYTTKIFSLKNIRRILWDEPCKLNIMIVKLKLSWFFSSMNPVKPQRLNTKGGSVFTRESLESWLSISRKFIQSYRKQLSAAGPSPSTTGHTNSLWCLHFQHPELGKGQFSAVQIIRGRLDPQTFLGTSFLNAVASVTQSARHEVGHCSSWPMLTSSLTGHGWRSPIRKHLNTQLFPS